MTINTYQVHYAIKDLLDRHMAEQPYRIVYSDGSVVDFESKVDCAGDLTLTICLPQHLINRINDLEYELSEAKKLIKDLEYELSKAKKPIKDL